MTTGYGACPSHRQETNTRWDTKRKSLALKIDISTVLFLLLAFQHSQYSYLGSD